MTSTNTNTFIVFTRLFHPVHIPDPEKILYQESKKWNTIGQYYGWKIQQFLESNVARLTTYDEEDLITGTVDEVFLRIEEISNVLARSDALCGRTGMENVNPTHGFGMKWLTMDCYFGWKIQLLAGTNKARIVTVDGEPLVCGSYDEMHDRIKEVSDVFSKSNIQIDSNI